MSDIRANTISDAAGTGPIALTGQSAAKAWVNFDGTGTIAVRDSFNVSSLTDSATGNYFINVTSSFANTLVACPSSTHATGVSWMASPLSSASTTSAMLFSIANVSSSSVDAAQNHLAALGDLA